LVAEAGSLVSYSIRLEVPKVPNLEPGLDYEVVLAIAWAFIPVLLAPALPIVGLVDLLFGPAFA